MTKSKFSMSIFCWLIAMGFSAFAQKQLSFTDKTYEPQIKTVQLYPNFGGTLDFLQPASTALNQQTLLLEFDDLQDQRSNYYVKLIHCNYDWTQSQLADLDFMNDFNEFPFTDFSLSSSTMVRYIHYKFQVPNVKLPGNYLLIVYRDDISNLVLSRRMMVYDEQINFLKNNEFIGAGTLDQTLQLLNFVVDYGEIDIVNPTETVHVSLRQNQRWDNAKYNIPFSYFNDSQNQLEYKSTGDRKQFSGNNEFRFVDFRSLNSPGVNTGRINKSVKPYELFLQVDLPRGDVPYTITKDNNGAFIIDNIDYGEPAITGNYLYVNFSLKTTTPYDGDVYLIGKFNDYQRNTDSKMKFNSTTGMYESRQFLKQGWYDYLYVLDSKTLPEYTIEGSHFETENTYEVAIYNHPFRPNADLLLGYSIITLNPR